MKLSDQINGPHPFRAFDRRDRTEAIAVALAELDGKDPDDWKPYLRKATWLVSVFDFNAASNNIHPARQAG